LLVKGKDSNPPPPAVSSEGRRGAKNWLFCLVRKPSAPRRGKVLSLAEVIGGETKVA